jgi:nicotinate-nucleotide adenylyltransferase
MEFLRRASGRAQRVAIFPGSFHPPTRAHVALAKAALDLTDEVVWVLPRRFPHKEYEGATLEQRAQMLQAVTSAEPRFSAAITEGGLFIEIARECREAYGEDAELWFLCGRDAAERIVNWDYGQAGAFAAQLREFGLLVAERSGGYSPPPSLAHRIRTLPMRADYSDVSASEVRRRIGAGEPWEDLVPPEVASILRREVRK